MRFHAGFVSSSILREDLRPSDLRGALSQERRAELDRLFRRQVLIGGTLRATLYGSSGAVVYSTGPIPGFGAGSDDLAGALGGGTESRITSIDIGLDRAKVLETLVPVRLDDGTVSGALAIDHDYAPIARSARKAFLPVAGILELVLFVLYVALFPILRRTTQRMRRQVEQIEHQALHDGLTGLPNRALLSDRIEQAVLAAKRSGGGAAVLLLDLDRFKEVNDTLGHQSGDLLLQALGERLRRLLRGCDTVARLGGDEFAILSPGTADAAGALFLAERVRQAMSEPFVVASLQLEVEASIGIALFPEHGEDVETLLRHADVAMYVSKETHAPRLYDPAADHYSTERLSLAGELRRAIDDGELVVYYQPRVEVATREIRNVEALVRWQHPEHGLLGPEAFIPLAEQTGLARPLTRYVLNAALGQCRTWQDQGLDVGVAVNLFGRGLLDVGLPDEVDRMLEGWGLHPARLELEITENTILADPTRARAILARLSERNIGLAIDDFGSGYSSLNYLKRLPASVLKIDKSFVLRMAADENDAVIVRSTIDLGHNLGLEVVAEGVENEEIFQCLVGLGCDTAQGYYFGSPAPAEQLTSSLRKARPPKRRRLARVSA